jgi:sulfite reductase (NADPH) hemoprotein beta-component
MRLRMSRELFAKGIAHVTTRQSSRSISFRSTARPTAMRRLAGVGLTSREACGNAVRNMTACPLAGVCPKEHVDVGKHVDGATVHFLRNPLNQQLPRKFKISFSGCDADCAQSLLHDCGVIATVKDGQPGFRIRAGGGLGHKPRESIVVEEWIAESELLFAMEALVTLHNKYSDRTKRAKSRIKFLVERFGEQGFRKSTAKSSNAPEGACRAGHPQGEWRQPGGGETRPGAPRKLFAQRRGLSVLPVALPTGDMTAPQMRGIAAFVARARLGEIRTTQDQNLSIFQRAAGGVAALRGGLASWGCMSRLPGMTWWRARGLRRRLGITASR